LELRRPFNRFLKSPAQGSAPYRREKMRTEIESAIIQVALSRLAATVKRDFLNYATASEQFGIAFVANALHAQGLFSYSCIGDLEVIREAAFNVAKEVEVK